MIATHARVVLAKEIPEESAIPGDVGTVVEEYRDTQGTITDYELKILSVDGQTVAVCRVPTDAVCEAMVTDRLCSRASTDPTIDEIRAVRHRISEQCGHDPKKLVEYYMKFQEEKYANRLVRPMRPSSSQESRRET